MAESVCCFIDCKRQITGSGNNAQPMCTGKCCDRCNAERVIPARLGMKSFKGMDLLSALSDE
jgi:hypothetical protein